MARDKKDKKKGRKFKMGNQQPLKDALDDNDREQVKPREEPLPEDQDEQWAYPERDRRAVVSTRGKDDE
jgi:hypothetical protein